MQSESAREEGIELRRRRRGLRLESTLGRRRGGCGGVEPLVLLLGTPRRGVGTRALLRGAQRGHGEGGCGRVVLAGGGERLGVSRVRLWPGGNWQRRGRVLWSRGVRVTQPWGACDTALPWGWSRVGPGRGEQQVTASAPAATAESSLPSLR